MSRITLKEYCTQNGFNRVSKVRINASGYPYVTLICAEDGSLTENLYCSKNYAAQVAEGEVLPITTLFVTEVINDGGEKRMKLTNSAGEVSEAKLADYQSF